MARHRPDSGSARYPHLEGGFSLIELMVVVVLMGVAAGMAMPVTRSYLTSSKADSASIAAAAGVDTAHDRAVAERRNIELTFIAPNVLRLVRHEVPGPTKTTIAEFTLENGQQFHKFAYVPDTPDHFGSATATSFTGTPPVMFTSDGSLIDSNGDVVNGTILIGNPSDVTTARAVTIFGGTGLMRSWKWRGGTWME